MTLPTLSKTSKHKKKGQSENIRNPAVAVAERNQQFIPSFRVFAAGAFGASVASIFAAGVFTSSRPASLRLGPASLDSVSAASVFAVSIFKQLSPRPDSLRPASSHLGPASSDSVSAASVSSASIFVSWASIFGQRLYAQLLRVFTSWASIFVVIAFASTAFAASVSESQYNKKKLLEHLTQ